MYNVDTRYHTAVETTSASYSEGRCFNTDLQVSVTFVNHSR
jgi:hypothetical protein